MIEQLLLYRRRRHSQQLQQLFPIRPLVCFCFPPIPPPPDCNALLSHLLPGYIAMPRLPSKHSAQIPHPAFSSPFLDSHSGSHASLAIIHPKRKENRTATTTPFRIEDLCSSIVLHFLVVLAAAAQQDANPLLFFSFGEDVCPWEEKVEPRAQKDGSNQITAAFTRPRWRFLFECSK